MEKLSFTKLGLKTNTEYKTIAYNEMQIQVKQYLPIEDKKALIEVTLQEAWDAVNGIIDPVFEDLYFNLNIVFKYTNISFTDKQREDPGKLYDLLASNGVLDIILTNIPENEYNDLMFFFNQKKECLRENATAFAPQLSKFMDELPVRMKEAADIAANFNPQQFANVIQFAEAGNGGRPVPLNE